MHALNTELSTGAAGVVAMVNGKALLDGEPPGALIVAVAGPAGMPGVRRTIQRVGLAPHTKSVK